MGFIDQYVRVHLPLQQGLRPENVGFDAFFATSASASSITTRIKTGCSQSFSCMLPSVRVHLPLQQGLRPANLLDLEI